MIAPEDLQYVLGIHPDQIQASQALAQASQGDPSAMQGGDQAGPPPPEPRPISTDKEEEKSEDNPDSKPVISAPKTNEPRSISAEPVTIAPRQSVIPKTEQQPAPDENAEAAPSATVPGQTQDTASVSDLMSTPIRPISADQQQMGEIQQREAKDRTKLNSLIDSGSGVSQFQHRHHILGPIVRGLEIAGSVVSPGAMRMVPGTTLYHNDRIAETRNQLESDLGDEAKHQTMSDHEALDESRRETNAARDETNRIKRTGVEEKFIAGSEKEDPNSPTGYTAQNFKGEWKPYTPPQSYKPSKGENFSDMQKRRASEADSLKLAGDDRKFYLANGKLREPNPNQPQVDEDRRARLQRQQQHDQDMQMQRYQADHARWAEHKSAIEKDQEQEYAKIENDWRKKYGPESNNDITDKKDSDPEKKNAVAERDANKKLVEDAVQARFKELGPEPNQPQLRAAPAEAPAAEPAGTDADGAELAIPAGVDSKGKPLASVQKPLASVRSYHNNGTPARTVEGVDAQGRKTLSIAPDKGDDVGPAPANSPEGRTGKLPDGTKVVVKGGRLVAQ